MAFTGHHVLKLAKRIVLIMCVFRVQDLVAQGVIQVDSERRVSTLAQINVLVVFVTRSLELVLMFAPECEGFKLTLHNNIIPAQALGISKLTLVLTI